MLRGGIWRNQGRFNRALFRAGQRRAYSSPKPNQPSSSSHSTQEGSNTPAANSTSGTPPNSQKQADGALPWQTSAAPPTAGAAGPATAAKGWGGGWGSSGTMIRREGPGADPADILLPHERAAREEAARRTAAAAAAAAAAAPGFRKAEAETPGVNMPGPPRIGRMPSNTTPQSPRIVPAHRTPTRSAKAHDSHQSSSLPPRDPRSVIPKGSAFRIDARRRGLKAPFGHLKAELNSSSSHRKRSPSPSPRKPNPSRSPRELDPSPNPGEAVVTPGPGETDPSDSPPTATQLQPPVLGEDTGRSGLDSIVDGSGSGGGAPAEWGHLRRRTTVLASQAPKSLDSLLAGSGPAPAGSTRKPAYPPKDWSTTTRALPRRGMDNLESMLTNLSPSLEQGARDPTTTSQGETSRTRRQGFDIDALFPSGLRGRGSSVRRHATPPKTASGVSGDSWAKVREGLPRQRNIKGGGGDVSGDPWAKVREGLARQESTGAEEDSGSWDWVDNFETNRRVRARAEDETGLEKEIVPPRPFAAFQEGAESGGAWRRDRGPRSNPDRGFDRRDRREPPQKTKVRRQRSDEAEDEDFDEDFVEERRRRKAEKKAQKEREQQRRAAEEAGPTPILLPEFISVSNLAVALSVKQDLFLRQLEELGFENISQESIMTGETAALVAQEYGFEPSVDIGEGVDLRPRPTPADPSTLPPRPPVVTIMGHVDHGKTTLLDYLRKSSVAAQEHGGITQHIGAFSVKMSSGKQITFLDTPGHAAFLTMRQRGAHVTDIVILVVAADDSVKPQTIEALKHARASKVPIIVAINKVDKEGARIDLVKSDLAKNGVEIEDYGGDVQVVCVSGKTGQGMGDLEENIITLSEILDMRAETDGMAEGWVLESSVKPIGRVATVLIKRGTLRTGDCIVAGKVWGKVRVLRNEAGVEITEAPPGTPVEILGWRELPDAGDQVLQAPDEGKAKDAAHYRIENSEREKAVAEMTRVEQEKRERERAAEAEADGDEDSPATGPETGPKIINFVVKGDVHGSVEAVCASVEEIGSNEVRPRILRSAPGQITESDVEHAATSGSIIINFNNPIPSHIKGMADGAGVKILDHNIIYHLTDDIRSTLSEHLTPLLSTKVVGEAEVLQVFPINLKGRVFKNIAGCRVRNGQVTRSAKYRVLRRGEKVFEGDVDSLKHGKKDVPEIRKGAECGISFVDWEDFRQGDQIQAFEEISTKRHL